MRYVDVFNGDADGLCALRQLRLAQPVESTLVTGTKRDIRLLARVSGAADVQVTVLDISLERNRGDLLRVLAEGAHVDYFDHHFAGTIPAHPQLQAHIDTGAMMCTSALVDRHLQGRYRRWAITAAFGDNLAATARQLAASLHLPAHDLERLRSLGEALNYNAYGETLDDLLIAPDALYRRMAAYDDPLAFDTADPIATTLRKARADDMAQAGKVTPFEQSAVGTIVVLPPAAWSRRVLGSFAHQLAAADPSRAHAVLCLAADGLAFVVSVRAPQSGPGVNADALCRQFPTGGGRVGAAGIDRLPNAMFDAFAQAFRAWARHEDGSDTRGTGQHRP